MTFQRLHVEKSARVTTIMPDRPVEVNAINPLMHRELDVALAAETEQFICVIAGAGEKAFCAGGDLEAVDRHAGQSAY